MRSRARIDHSLRRMAEPKITPDARKLLATLVKKQDRAWFAAHKDEVTAKLTEPVRAVLSGIGPRVMKSFPDHVAGELDLGPASVYFHVDPKDCFAATGPWMMEPAGAWCCRSRARNSSWTARCPRSSRRTSRERRPRSPSSPKQCRFVPDPRIQANRRAADAGS